jgi:hypothetical protein
MELIVSYKSAHVPWADRKVLAKIHLPAAVADEIACNMNTQLEHKFVLELASVRHLTDVTVPPGGLR